jgi:glycosyltransferase involved in cell wall biosynthesis
MISVIIPTYRNPKCLDICLKSALENQASDNEIIVVIDGFVEESKSIIEKYIDKVNFIPMEENYGMQHALNVGVFNANSEWVLIVNDDNVFPKDWDVILKKDFQDKLVITPNQIERSYSIFDFIEHDFGGVDDFDYDGYVKTEPNYRENVLMNNGGIFPFAIQKKYYMAVGGFDTLYESPFICDWDYFLKLELIGCDFLRSKKLNFYHFGSIATKNSSESDRFNLSESDAAKTFEYKWGFRPFRNPVNNSHSPIGHSFRGIRYE